MSKIVSFEDLECWQKSLEETNMIYDALKSCRDFGFRDQIQRASISVMNNIAEWFGRLTTGDRIHFMNIAIGSLYEVRSMLYLGRDQKYFTLKQFEWIQTHNQLTMNILLWFVRYLHSLKHKTGKTGQTEQTC